MVRVVFNPRASPWEGIVPKDRVTSSISLDGTWISINRLLGVIRDGDDRTVPDGRDIVIFSTVDLLPAKYDN